MKEKTCNARTRDEATGKCWSNSNLQRSGPTAFGEQTDDQGQFLGTAGLLD